MARTHEGIIEDVSSELSISAHFDEDVQGGTYVRIFVKENDEWHPLFN